MQQVYEVDIHGIKHTFLLTPEQAKERGLTDENLQKKEAPAPRNKARAPRNKKD